MFITDANLYAVSHATKTCHLDKHLLALVASLSLRLMSERLLVVSLTASSTLGKFLSSRASIGAIAFQRVVALVTNSNTDSQPKNTSEGTAKYHPSYATTQMAPCAP